MKNIVLATGLLFSVFTMALPIYEQQREVLYAMHTVGQDFADVNFVKQNVDMFISVFKIHTDFVEAQFAVANQKAKRALLTNGALIAGATLAKVLTNTALAYALDQIYMNPSCTTYRAFADHVSALIDKTTFGFLGVGNVYAAVSLFDAFKERNALKEALTLDQAILDKLIAIKESVIFSVDGDSAEEPANEKIVVIQQV